MTPAITYLRQESTSLETSANISFDVSSTLTLYEQSIPQGVDLNGVSLIGSIKQLTGVRVEPMTLRWMRLRHHMRIRGVGESNPGFLDHLEVVRGFM